MMSIILILQMLIAPPFPEDADIHPFIVANGIPDLDIVSLYIWNADLTSKGANILEGSLQPDSTVLLFLPSGRMNVLAFDELGNAYGIPGLIKKNAPDTLVIDLEHITYGRPNVDFGTYMLNIENTIYGFSLDTIRISSPGLDGEILLGAQRVFPGTGIIIWLNKGIYSIEALDRTGGEYSTGKFLFPARTGGITIDESMRINPSLPVGIVGYGSASLLIVNRLPLSALTGLEIIPEAGSEGVSLDNISLQPGESIVAALAPGPYTLTAMDEAGAEYRASFDLDENSVWKLFLTSGFMIFDFSFP
jgi:hypothetical protein